MLGVTSLISTKGFIIAFVSVLFINIVYMKYTNIKQENLITVLQSDKAIIQSDLDNLTLTSKNQAQQNTLLLDEIDKLSLEYLQANKDKKILSARLAEQLKTLEKIKESDADAKSWSDSLLPSSVVQLLNNGSG